MSADNGLVVRRNQKIWEVLEYNASSGSEYPLCEQPTLTDATRWAQDYQASNLVEYGISFDFGEKE